MLTPPKNPILERLKRDQEFKPSFDVTTLKTPYTHRGKVRSNREYKKFLRTETAMEALGQLYPGCSIFGITKGQFSLTDLITATLAQIGPAHLFISTWTANIENLNALESSLAAGRVLSVRFLVDHTFSRRKPESAAVIRERFGRKNIRVTRNHSKFVLMDNEKWKIVITTTMNLNMNPRLEHFVVEDNPDLAAYLMDLMDEIFQIRRPSDIDYPSYMNESRFVSL